MATIPMGLHIPNSLTGPAFPKGKVIEFVMNSSESKFYPGVNAVFQRHVCVYVPAGYVAGTEVPVIVSVDAYGMPITCRQYSTTSFMTSACPPWLPS